MFVLEEPVGVQPRGHVEDGAGLEVDDGERVLPQRRAPQADEGAAPVRRYLHLADRVEVVAAAVEQQLHRGRAGVDRKAAQHGRSVVGAHVCDDETAVVAEHELLHPVVPVSRRHLAGRVRREHAASRAVAADGPDLVGRLELAVGIAVLPAAEHQAIAARRCG